MFEQTFKNIDDILHKDAGCSSELDYVEQTSWILFLKYLDDFEKDRKTSAELSGQTYAPIIEKEYRWNIWAAPKKDGKLDHHHALIGDDLWVMLVVMVVNIIRPVRLLNPLLRLLHRLSDKESMTALSVQQAFSVKSLSI